MKLNPLTIKKIRRFKSIRRGYYSFIVILSMILASLGAELIVNSRALVVRYQGQYFFPTYGNPLPGKTFGFGYESETNYRQLQRAFEQAAVGNWVLMPPV